MTAFEACLSLIKEEYQTTFRNGFDVSKQVQDVVGTKQRSTLEKMATSKIEKLRLAF